MGALPVTQVIGKHALVDVLDLSEVAWTCWGVFLHWQWAGAEDGEGVRPLAGTGNEREETKRISMCAHVCYHAQVECWQFESRTEPKLNLSVELCQFISPPV